MNQFVVSKKKKKKHLTNVQFTIKFKFFTNILWLFIAPEILLVSYPRQVVN